MNAASIGLLVVIVLLGAVAAYYQFVSPDERQGRESFLYNYGTYLLLAFILIPLVLFFTR